MAKGTLNGLLSGKLGNSVFYKVTNSADKEKQGVRQYAATIANPKTEPQATQRMRMKPAINFYRGLADLLDHSWEGVKYGALSRQKFMSLALNPELNGVPFVQKGETRFVPGEYPISLGSVAFDSGVGAFNNYVSQGKGWLANFNLSVASDVLEDGTTWGEWSKQCVKISGGLLRDGDELTFVAVYRMGDQFIPKHSYVVLDFSSTDEAMDILNRAGLYLFDSDMAFTVGDLHFAGEDITGSFLSDEMVAAGIIVSRHPSRTSTTWLRSSSNLVCSDAFKAEFMSNAALQDAIASYQSSETDLTSDWLLNQAGGSNATGGDGGSSVVKSTVANVSVGVKTSTAVNYDYTTAAVLTNSTYKKGAVIIKTYEDGSKTLFTVSGSQLVEDGNSVYSSNVVFNLNTISIEQALNLLQGYSVVYNDPDKPSA